MPLPFLVGAVAAKVVLGAAVAAGAAGTVSGVKGAMNSSKAKELQGRAEDIIYAAKLEIEGQKKTTTNIIKDLGKVKIEVYGTQVKRFVDEFSKLKNVQLSDSNAISEDLKCNITAEELGQMKELATNSSDLIAGGIGGIGAGVLLGAGTYGGVMALGTASTGAAIGGLSGVAATNATLAWLGGGSLAAGGGGMALGTAVLGGVVAGPALLLAGGYYNAKSKEKLNNAYSNLAEARQIDAEISLACTTLDLISRRATQFKTIISKIKTRFNTSINTMVNEINGETEWKSLSNEAKQKVAVAMKYAQVTKAILDIPLLDEEGNLSLESEELLYNREYKQMAGMIK